MTVNDRPVWRGWGIVAAAAVVGLLLSCGGGQQSGQALSTSEATLRYRAAMAAPPPAPSAQQLMDWAQRAYPMVFPGAQPDIYVSPYVYRYYPGTGNYLGVAGGMVYVMGPVSGGPLKPVGTVDSFTCSVFPYSCGTELSSVTAHLSTPASITAELPNGAYMPDAYLSGWVSGDLAALNGRTLYLIVEDPYGLYQPGALNPFRSGTSVSVTLYGAPQLVGGLKTGELKIHACLDPQCATRLAGSPLIIPFNVNVGDGVVLDTHAVQATGAAYEIPASASVQVTLPRYLQSWSARLEPATNMAGAIFTPSVLSSGPGATTGTVVVDMRAMAPGTYTQTIRVLAVTRMPLSAQSQEVFADFTMSLVVTGTAVPAYTITPAQISITRHYGAQGFEATAFSYAANRPGVSVIFAGIGSYTFPAAATGYTQVRSWWNNSGPSTGNQYGTRICSTYLGDAHACLPVGTYTTIMSYDIYEGLSYSRIGVPITLNVVP